MKHAANENCERKKVELMPGMLLLLTPCKTKQDQESMAGETVHIFPHT